MKLSTLQNYSFIKPKKMKPFCFLVLYIILFLYVDKINAQNDKVVVAIYDFSYNPDLAYKEFLPTIKQTVTSAFQRSGRFTILNRASDGLIEKELKLQKTREYFSNSMIEQGKRVGAKYVVSGDVDRISVQEKSGSQGAVSYAAGFAFMIKVIDIEKNEIIASEQINASAGDGMFGMFSSSSSSPRAAIDGTLKKIDEKIDKFILKYFGSSEINISEIIELKGNKVTKVLIAGGSTSGLSKGLSLEVFTPVEAEKDGKKIIRKKSIGIMVIEKVEDENFSICKIKDGGELIKIHSDKGDKLIAKLEIK